MWYGGSSIFQSCLHSFHLLVYVHLSDMHNGQVASVWTHSLKAGSHRHHSSTFLQLRMHCDDFWKLPTWAPWTFPWLHPRVHPRIHCLPDHPQGTWSFDG